MQNTTDKAMFYGLQISVSLWRIARNWKQWNVTMKWERRSLHCKSDAVNSSNHGDQCSTKFCRLISNNHANI